MCHSENVFKSDPSTIRNTALKETDGVKGGGWMPTANRHYMSAEMAFDFLHDS